MKQRQKLLLSVLEYRKVHFQLIVSTLCAAPDKVDLRCSGPCFASNCCLFPRLVLMTLSFTRVLEGTCDLTLRLLGGCLVLI